MRRLFTMMANQIQSTASSLAHWWRTLSPDPSTWVPFTWILLALLFVLLLVLILRPRRRPRRRPELLVSHGEVRFAEEGGAVASSLRAPEGGAYVLSMVVSNLSPVPVQLLELAVRTNGSPTPTTAEVPAVLPPHGAVEVSADLRGAGGDEGILELFVYVPDMPPKTFRVRAKLLWEPWNARFRVLPLDQTVEPVRRPDGGSLAGPDRRERRRAAVDRRAYEARFPDTAVEEEVEETVRFEPRPESARPRGSGWPQAAATEPWPAPERERPDRPARAPRDAEGAATWPPRRPPLAPGGRGPDGGPGGVREGSRDRARAAEGPGRAGPWREDERAPAVSAEERSGGPGADATSRPTLQPTSQPTPYPPERAALRPSRAPEEPPEAGASPAFGGGGAPTDSLEAARREERIRTERKLAEARRREDEQRAEEARRVDAQRRAERDAEEARREAQEEAQRAERQRQAEALEAQRREAARLEAAREDAERRERERRRAARRAAELAAAGDAAADPRRGEAGDDRRERTTGAAAGTRPPKPATDEAAASAEGASAEDASAKDEEERGPARERRPRLEFPDEF